jgi:RHS repeat-associated protein
MPRYGFDPWGRRTVVSGVADTKAGFTGHDIHEATGLTLALYRAYDAENGTWVSEDPLGLAGGLNLYSYAARDPIRRVDPTGLVAVSIKDPVIIDSTVKKIGGCGATYPRLRMNGKSTCEGGSWRAKLSLSMAPEIHIAKDSPFMSRAQLIAHEQGHWAAVKALVPAMTSTGEVIEGTSYPSESQCNAAWNSWRKNWEEKVQGILNHTGMESVLNALRCPDFSKP